MSKRFSINNPRVILLIFAEALLFFFTFVVSSSGKDGLVEKKGPITITASTLNADNKAHTALFEGSVIARTATMTMSSDRMLVYYAEGGKITKIEVHGHVKVTSAEKVITSEDATYLAEEDMVIFTGQPRAVEGNNVVTGTKMTYLFKEDRSLVDNSKVIIDTETGKGPDLR